MRNLFIVAAKILGLFQFCSALEKFSKSGFPFSSHDLIGIFFQSFFTTPLLIALAFVLVFKTDWLADKVGLADKTESPSLTRDDLLAAGLKILGLFFAVFFAHCILALLVFSLMGLLGVNEANLFLGGPTMFSCAVMFIFSVLFIFRTNAVITMLTLAESAPWRKVVVATLVVLGVIFIITAISTLDSIKRSRTFYSSDNPMWNEKEITPYVEHTIP